MEYGQCHCCRLKEVVWEYLGERPDTGGNSKVMEEGGVQG